MEPPLELEERDLDGKGILLGDTLIVEEEFIDWFLSHFAEALQAADRELEENAAAFADDQSIKFITGMALFHFTGMGPTDKRWLHTDIDELKKRLLKPVDHPVENLADNLAKAKIDRLFAESKTVLTLEALAKAASNKKPDGDKYPVSRTTVSNIYNGFGANSLNRQYVASVINELVPCTRDDLKRTKTRPRKSPKPKSKTGK
jgi:hypothetical protein